MQGVNPRQPGCGLSPHAAPHSERMGGLAPETFTCLFSKQLCKACRGDVRILLIPVHLPPYAKILNFNRTKQLYTDFISKNSSIECQNRSNEQYLNHTKTRCMSTEFQTFAKQGNRAYFSSVKPSNLFTNFNNLTNIRKCEVLTIINFLAPKSEVFAPKSVEKFTTSDFRKTTSEVI